MNPRSISISGIAHDLNNQLMIVLNSLDRISALNSGTPELAMAVSAAELCVELTARLLPCTTPTLAGSASIREIASETALLVRSILPTFNRLELECPADCHVSASQADIQQVLMNLCLNAVQAMDGPGVIRLVVTQESDSAFLSVYDTGPGIPPEMRERIFDPLFTTKAERGGHGLGLVRVRETVHRLGGIVEVQNIHPHGAWFRIRIPRAPSSVTLELAHLGD